MTLGPMMHRCGTCGEQWWDAHCCPKQNQALVLPTTGEDEAVVPVDCQVRRLLPRLRNGPAPLGDPNLNDEAADVIERLCSEREVQYSAMANPGHLPPGRPRPIPNLAPPVSHTNGARALLIEAVQAHKAYAADHPWMEKPRPICVDVADLESLLAGLASMPMQDTVADDMDEVAKQYAHKLAMNLECLVLECPPSARFFDEANSTLGEYRSAMNKIHERECPTHMGEPLLKGQTAQEGPL